MNIVIFDTETISVNKPFCYNIGYVIANSTGEVLLKKEFVIEQVWHNTALFSTAYYEKKRPLYISAMRARKATLKKFGYACREMINDFESFEVSAAYAYNSSFDEKVFTFNCDWFKCVNPFDTIPIFDIRGNVHKSIAFTSEFQEFCEKHSRFTECGNYSTTAETVFQFVQNDENFEEAHTALNDAEIECTILFETIRRGCKLNEVYTTYNSIPRQVEKELTIEIINEKTGEEGEYKFRYIKRKNSLDGKLIVLTQ